MCCKVYTADQFFAGKSRSGAEKKKKILETVAGAIESCRSVFVLIFVKLLLQFLDYTAASYIRSVVKRYWLSAWIVQLVTDY